MLPSSIHAPDNSLDPERMAQLKWKVSNQLGARQESMQDLLTHYQS